MKSLFYSILGLFIISFTSSCTRIDQGHVGLKIDLAGGSKGDGIVEVSGWVFYMPGFTTVEEFPTFTQTADYEDFVVTAKGGTQFHVDPTLNYSVISAQAVHVYQNYRKPLKELEATIIKPIVYDAYRLTANRYSADSLMNNRSSFEEQAEAYLTNALLKDGFKFDRITSGLKPPASMQAVVDAKNQSIQVALKAENDVKTAEAEAKIAVAQANGQASANVAVAKGEYEAARFRAMANKELQSSYTDNFVKVEWINAWKQGGSQVPTYMMGGGNSQFLMQLPK
jgi:regulator of protease activity HflC (stomatin/prohibitin superfamily)